MVKNPLKSIMDAVNENSISTLTAFDTDIYPFV